MKITGYALLLLLILAAALVLAGQLGFLAGQVPDSLGVVNGRLSPPSTTPNSVSSQAMLYPNHPQKDYASMTPLAYSGDGDLAIEKLAALLQKTEHTRVITRGPGYIYAQCRTPLLQFTDDLEFWLDRRNSVIQVRSASRLGRRDFGVNRARMETIRARFSS
jgi:uncharacterized protein (DUF1499 family)